MIRTEGLSKRFGTKQAVDHLDLDIPEGEFFCFLGPNGAGKTTTIKMLTGLVRPTAGRAWIGTHDVVEEPVEAKRLLGYVPDHPFLYDKLTGREFMRFVAGLYRLPAARYAERVDELLATFELAHVADQLVESYSHGMRQKLSFASTFLHEPLALVVDEPWVGLDPKNIRAVKTYLRRAADSGLTILMSTHTLSIAEELADRIGILHHGRLRHVGTVDEIKRLARAAAVDGAAEGAEGGPSSSLEDVFLELTREADDEAAALATAPSTVVSA
ncbi:MAG: ABC transporter ATP-binding protein [Acidobacteriota bacterium]